ncbi:MAG: hypothetical protein ACT4P1_00950 [Sporichthyaceae bacterium]
MNRRLVPAAILGAVLLAGCGADDPLQDSAGLAAPTPTLTEAAPLPAPSSSTDDESGVSEVEPIASAGAELPEPIEVAQGDEVFGVYLAVVEGAESTDEIDVAEADAVSNGWLYSSGELGCDMGAAEELGLGEGEYFRVAVYFATQDDAQAFADGYAPGVVGIAQATLFCLD